MIYSKYVFYKRVSFLFLLLSIILFNGCKNNKIKGNDSPKIDSKETLYSNNFDAGSEETDLYQENNQLPAYQVNETNEIKNIITENGDLIIKNDKISERELTNLRDNLLNYIIKKYNKKITDVIKGTSAAATLYEIFWIFELILNDTINDEEEIKKILNKLRIITLQLKKTKEKNSNNDIWRVELLDIDLKQLPSNNKNDKIEDRLKLLFTNVEKKIYSLNFNNSLNQNKSNLNSILKTIIEIDKFKGEEPPKVNFFSDLHSNVTTNIIVFLVFIQGGLRASKIAWWLNDLLIRDKSGALLYQKAKNKYKRPIITVNFLDTKVHLLTDINFIKQLLYDSPEIFEVGRYKRQFFKSFMKDNVGIASKEKWYDRRKLNDEVLNIDFLHPYAYSFNKIIQKSLKNCIPKKFDEFDAVGNDITSQIVFGKNQIAPEETFKTFKIAQSPKSLIFPNYKIDDKVINTFTGFMKKHIKDPHPNSLVYQAVNTKNKYCPHLNKGSCPQFWETELLGQIPHWIFPVSSTFNSLVPRVLILLKNHPKKLQKLINDIKKIDINNPREIFNLKYLRNCILEASRLNVLSTTFVRELNKDYYFDNKKKYFLPKGSHITLLSNPILRDTEKYYEPNKFIPERWSKDLENSTYSAIFGSGPQRCPGKELNIFIQQSFIVNYLKEINFNLKSDVKLNTEFIDLMINPFIIKFK